MPSVSIKCVIVGDQQIGKTCLLNSYVHPNNQFERQHIPTVFDTFLVTKEQNATQINLGLYDTSGSDENEVMRLDTYSQTNVFIIAFAIDNIKSFENVKNKWFKEITHFGQYNVPVLLIGLKADARNTDPIQGKAEHTLANDEALDISLKSPKSRQSWQKVLKNSPASTSLREIVEKKKTITYAQGITLHKEIGAAKYIECSSFESEGIDAVFGEVLRLGYQKK